MDLRMILAGLAAVAALGRAGPARAQLDTARIDSTVARHVRTARAPVFQRLTPIRTLSRSGLRGRQLEIFYVLVGRSAGSDGAIAVFACQGTNRTDSTLVACVRLPIPGRPSGVTPTETNEYAIHAGACRGRLCAYLGYGASSSALEHNLFYVIDVEPFEFEPFEPLNRIAASVHVYYPGGFGLSPELSFEPPREGDRHHEQGPAMGEPMDDIEVRGAVCRPPREEGARPVGCRDFLRVLHYDPRTDSWRPAARATRPNP